MVQQHNIFVFQAYIDLKQNVSGGNRHGKEKKRKKLLIKGKFEKKSIVNQ